MTSDENMDWQKKFKPAFEFLGKWLFRFRTMKSLTLFFCAEIACVGYYSFWIQGHIKKDGQQTVDWTISSGEATLYGCLIGLFILIGYLAALAYQYTCDKRKFEAEMQKQSASSNQGDPYKGEKWLKELLEHFNVYMMDEYFQTMPAQVRADLLTSFDYWMGILGSSAFNIKDKILSQAIDAFYKKWHEIVTFGCKYYFTSQNPDYYRFEQYQHDTFQTDEARRAFEKLAQMVIELQPTYTSMVEYIKTNYPDIDLDKTSQIFMSGLAKN